MIWSLELTQSWAQELRLMMAAVENFTQRQFISFQRDSLGGESEASKWLKEEVNTKRCQCEWSIQQNVCVQSPRCHWLSEDGIIIVTTSKNRLGQLPPGERGHIRWWRTRTISAVNCKYLTGCRCDDKLDITSLELYSCCGLYFIAVPAPTSDHAGAGHRGGADVILSSAGKWFFQTLIGWCSLDPGFNWVIN